MSNGNSNNLASTGWTERDWEGLFWAIKYKQCTPFLGAGACAGVLPLGKEIAAEWAAEGYPFPDKENLPRVSQYISVVHGARVPHHRLKDKFRGKGPPDFSNPHEPHRLVADLWLPVYITTNYDEFMTKALDGGGRRPMRLVCNWYRARQVPLPAYPELRPTPEQPVVFHLHGNLENVDSMVLTEDDYLDFLRYTSEIRELIPPQMEEAFAASLLFLGYSLEDLNFKVLFRRLADHMRRSGGSLHVSVQLDPRSIRPGAGANRSPAEDENVVRAGQEQMERTQKQVEYLERHFGLQRVKVYWGTCDRFASELRQKWQEFQRVHP
jgi:hypothetical protein